MEVTTSGTVEANGFRAHVRAARKVLPQGVTDDLSII